MNVVNATELSTLKQLVLCYANSTSILKVTEGRMVWLILEDWL